MRKLERLLQTTTTYEGVGFDISETTSKWYDESGIEKNVELRTQMEKAQLRFVQIMETSHTGFGGYGENIITPANAIAVYWNNRSQLDVLGSLIPVLIEFIPYVIAGTKITNMARAIAAMMGFELPEIDYK